MADIRCLICNRVNDASAERCWYCNNILPKPTGPLTLHEREKLAHLKKKIATDNKVKNEPPGESPNEANPEDIAEDPIPEWLARIRKLKQVDEKQSHTQQADWIDEEQPQWLKQLQQSGEDDSLTANEAASHPVVHEKPALDDSLEIRNLPRENDEEDLLSGIFDAKVADDVVQSPKTNGEPPLQELLETSFERTEELIGIDGENQIVGADLTDNETEKKVESEPTASAGAGMEKPFPMHIDNLPEWLSDEAPDLELPIEEEKTTVVGGDEEPAPVIEKARLPAWLQSLRPASQKAGEAEGRGSTQMMDDHGILAGIAGTLPGADLSAHEMKPGAFTQDLRASTQQQKNADLFRNLLRLDRVEQPVVPGYKPATLGEKIMRILVAVVILLAVIVPIISPGTSLIIPVLFPNELVNTLNTVDALQVEKPVLVAAHFEAGLAGELDWTAQPVFKHLVARGIPMALTSTNVIGSAMLREMVSSNAGVNPAYLMEDKVIELGYLPGGVIGMGAMVADPLTASPFTSEMQPVRDLPQLATIRTFSDYGALLILTDNPEYARAWVEQVSGGDANLPLLILVSAQAAPLVQPYYDSGQINGFVAGVNGALYYEMLRMNAGSATARFGTYQVSLLVIAALIFVGGVISLILTSTPHAKKEIS